MESKKFREAREGIIKHSRNTQQYKTNAFIERVEREQKPRDEREN